MAQILGDQQDNILEGTTENDIIIGLAGNDILQGSSVATAGEIDALIGGTGADTFVLGTPTKVFYDDGNDASNGIADYALITDFNPNVDIIKLGWSRNNYILGTAPQGLPEGTAIFLDRPGNEPDELIAMIQGVTGLDLNQPYFSFPSLSAVELSNVALDTDNSGFVIKGEAAGDRSGASVSNAGDVNGDGLDDLIVGAAGADPNGSNSGKSYVVFGKANGTAVSLSDVASGIGGFAINGQAAGDGAGGSVSSAGDVNGDGLADLIVGASGADPNGSNSGKTYVVFGKANGTTVSLSTVASGTGGFVINGEAAGDRSGSSVSDAGDVNGDGLSDLIIGATGGSPNSKAKAYVVFGKANGTAVNLSAVALGTGGFAINGSNGQVSNAGDVNGDGLDDLIVGASGKSYVVFGKADSKAVSLSEVEAGTGGFVINGSSSPVSNAGDVNGDGLDDLIVNTPTIDFYGKPKSYVVFGKADSGAVNLSDVGAGSGGFAINGGGVGVKFSSAGDVNGDGFDDLIVGTPGATPNGNSSGKSYLVLGKANGTEVNLTDVDSGIGGFAINGEAAGDVSGTSVSGAGDVNNDGFDDLIVGASGADPNGETSGKSYVIFGGDFLKSEPVVNENNLGSVLLSKPLVIPATELLKWNPDNTLIVTEVSNAVGGKVSLVDGVVTFQADPGFLGVATFEYTVNNSIDGTNTGTASMTVTSTLELSDVALNTNSSGFAISGEVTNDSSGWSVSGAGDVNGDGLADVIVGAPWADPNGKDSGKSYVVFGKTDGSAVKLSDVASGIGGFAIKGEAAGDLSGLFSAVSGGGDVNGDGLADLIVGAPGADPNGANSGKSYVVFGKKNGTAVELSNVAAGTGGFAINGEAGNGSGVSVSDAGDVNGDGLDDLIVGSSYVVFGKADNSSVELSNVAAGVGGFAIKGEAAADYAGFSVSGAGDVNGDGLNDLIVGAYQADPNGEGSGKSYVVFGKANGTTVNLSDVVAGNGGFAINGEAAGDSAGISVSDAGDVNGDGLADLIVGSQGADPNGKDSGKSYVVFGKTDGTKVNLSDVAAGNGGFAINGQGQSSISGGSVSSAGDVNGDGLDDLIIGTDPLTAIGVLSAIALPGAIPTIRSYVVFGKTNGTTVELSDVAAGIGGFAFNKDYLSSDAASSSVASVSSAEDVNGDGFDDVIVGTPFADANGNVMDNSGKSYVVYGGDFTGAVTQKGSTGADLLVGTTAADAIAAGQGNDTLIGNGGSDILYAGAGDDLITISDLNFNRIKGGSGTDTLGVDGSGMSFDLTTVANNRITGIEQIDLTGTGNNTLTFDKLDLLALSDTNQLIILGNVGDVVVSQSQGWTASGTQSLNGNLYNEYALGMVSLLVDADINQFIS